MSEKTFNPDLWKPIGGKPVDVSDVDLNNPRKTNSFLDYQAPQERYVVRGVMPEPPKYPTEEEPNVGRAHCFLGYLDEICGKPNEGV